MTIFAAVLATGRDAPGLLPAGVARAIALPGTRSPVRHDAGSFACAVAPTRPSSAGIFADGGVVAIGDVRLDAREELRAALRARGAPLGTGGLAAARTGSTARAEDDVALVAAAYGAWGEAAVARLRGDFSFALWDSRNRILIAARDGLGVRPLYYAAVPGGIAISNVVNAVRAYPGLSSQLHEPAVLSFLHIGWNADTTTTTFAAVKRLAPGTALIVDGRAAAPRVASHWTIPDPAPVSFSDEREYVERYRALLEAAVADRLEAPATTLFLSGGIDSPTIAAAAVRVAPSAVRLNAVTTRVTGVESAEESRLAAAVAERLGLPQRLVAEPTVIQLEKTPQTPEPCDDPEWTANCALLTTMAADAGVLFDGEDGDALFMPPGLGTMLRRYPAASVIRDIVKYTAAHGHHPYLGFWLKRRLRFWRRDASASSPGWLTPHGLAIEPSREPVRPPHRARPRGARSLTGSIWQNLHDGCDRGWHQVPIEYRWPLLDARLIEFVFSIPPIPWCQRKHLARRAYAGELPAEVIARPKTTIPGYFEAAVAGWRAQAGAAVPDLHERTRRYVDPVRLARVLHDGDTEDVLGAWRALQLDDWMRHAELQ